MTLRDIIEGIDTKEIHGSCDIDITHITNNSRECKKGSVFVAVRGYQTDGHKYMQSAYDNGALAIICEEANPDINCTQIVVSASRRAEAQAASNFYGNPHKKFKLIGITGTNGKTTVTYLIKHILEKKGKKIGLIGTNQNMIGDKVFETGRTTPDSIELQGIFAQMASEGVDYCIMEVSSHALELDRVYGCSFHVGAFTNLTQDHLDFHETMDNYARAKSALFALSESSVINADDDYSGIMLSHATGDVCTYGIKSDSMLRALDTRLSARGVEFKIGDCDIKLGIPGGFSVYNCLCAIGVSLKCGMELEEIASSLATAKGVKGRAEIVPTDTGYTVLIDYAHTPDGIENILNTVRGFAEGRVIIVFGCGGDRDNTKRPIMGRIAAERADFLVITSDNPRSENPMQIIRMIEEGVRPVTDSYVIIENRREAIGYAMENAREGDVIVLAGKGHETYQILNEGTIHFDEREVVRELLK